jgi:hypothetical protein
MCNWVAKENKETQFKLFVYLKLCYPSGKIQWIKQDKQLAELTLNNCSKTIHNNFNKLQDLGWINYDEEYNYYRVLSIEKLRQKYNWLQRRAYAFTYKDVNHIRATLGAVIYTQLYKTYCRKYLKRKSNVLKRESANESFTFSCNKEFAEVSVLSVQKFFGLSICKASRVKTLAANNKLLEVQKQYFKIEENQVYAARKGTEYRGERQNVIFKNGNYYLQLIDKVYSDLHFKKRKKLETL